MTVRDLDWRFLLARLGGPVALLLVASLLWGGSTLWRSTRGADLEAGRANLASLAEERRDEVERRHARQAFSRRYAELRRRGIVGADQRLTWVQAARQARQDLGLPYLRYSLGPQQSFTPPWPDATLMAPVRVSMMEIQAGLVHEQQLVQLLDRLQQATGLMQVRGCTLERLSTDVAPQPGKANVAATCQLGWFAVQPAPGLAASSPAMAANQPGTPP